MYTLKRILSLIAIGLCATHADAQYTPAIRSVRPGVTVGPNTVGKGILQFHLGGYKASDGRRNDTSVYYNNASRKYGAVFSFPRLLSIFYQAF